MAVNCCTLPASSSTQYESYSSALLAKIPIKHLLQKARSQQAQFRGLYAPMLRLLVTHYPHLCQVGDWLVEEQLRDDQGTDRKGAWSRCLVPIVSCSPKTLHEGKEFLFLDFLFYGSTFCLLTVVSVCQVRSV